MTTADFKYILSDNILGSPTNRVMILFNEYPGDIVTPIYNKIDAIAVRATNRNRIQLEQATNIVITVPNNGPILNISLVNTTIPLRTINKSYVENYYLYEIFPEEQRPIITAPTTGSFGYEVYTSEVIIEPGSFDEAYTNSSYNPQISNATEFRKSVFIFESERLKGQDAPSNLVPILAGTAQPASVQDSNYTDTGLVNGKYGGTKITYITNQGIDPFLAGQFFEGAVFNKDTPDEDAISLAAQNAVEWLPLFVAGQTRIPRQYVEDVRLSFYIDPLDEDYFTYTAGQTLFRTRTIDQEGNWVNGYYSQTTPLSQQLQIGDLLKVEINSTIPSTFLEEVAQVQPRTGLFTVNDEGQTGPYEYLSIEGRVWMTVKRGYNGTAKGTWSVDTGSASTQAKLYRIKPQQIYTIAGSKIDTLGEGKLVVKGFDETLRIAPGGIVVGGSKPVVS